MLRKQQLFVNGYYNFASRQLGFPEALPHCVYVGYDFYMFDLLFIFL